ncbi:MULTISPECIES: SLATT domain-containing protein [Bradyrhizobium]|uniref:SLATT domain-containing protein n=1 Tax=Bradyrhizobium TaxID=374 RepID=UPI00211ED3B3|nr:MULTISPECIES: SLATT domain-containing protein [Bradyrhizobium]
MTTIINGPEGRNGKTCLDPSIPADPERVAFESQVRESFGRCAYTHKTHEKMAEGYAARLTHIKLGQIVLSALTTGGAVGVIFDRNSVFYPYATALLAISLLILNSYVKDIDPGEAAQKHREAASDIWNIREAYLSLLADIRDASISLAELRRRRDELQAQLHKIYRIAPHTDARAYGKAQDALKNKEDLTFTDAEIDAFLPAPLKRGANTDLIKSETNS